MQKITELSETRYKTVREKDALGNRIPKQVAYTAFREVNVISGGKRFAHAFVDGIVYYVVYFFVEYILIHVFSSDQDPINTLLTGFFVSVIFMFLFPIYYIVFEHFFQTTPGKFLTKALVIDVYGNKPEIGTNILRNIIRLVPFEILSCLFNKRGWHDRWSETYVVGEDEYAKIKTLQLNASKDTFNKETDGDFKPVNTKLVKNIFLYVILPLSFLLYLGIIIKGIIGAKDAITKIGSFKNKRVTSEADEINAIADIYNDGQIDVAQQKLLEFTKSHKNYSLAWTILGHTYFDQKNNEKAIESYIFGIKVNKNDFSPHNGLGIVYTEKGDYKMAEKELRLADSLEPNNSIVIGNIANLYDELGDIKKSVKYGERSVQLDSQNVTLCANLSIYYYNNKQFKERNKMFTKAANLGYDNMQTLGDMVYPTDISEGCLDVSGNISNGYTDVAIEDVKVEVFNKDSILIRKMYTDEDGKYKFMLPLDIADNYLVKVSYQKYIHKYFQVSTENVPLKGWETKSPKINADISLSEKLLGIDYSFLDKPLSRYFFNSTKNNFDVDLLLLNRSIKQLKEIKSTEQKVKAKSNRN